MSHVSYPSTRRRRRILAASPAPTSNQGKRRGEELDNLGQEFLRRPFLQSNHASNVQQDKSFQSREATIERKGSLAEVENIALH